MMKKLSSELKRFQNTVTVTGEINPINNWCLEREIRWQEVRILSVLDFEEYYKIVAILITESMFANAGYRESYYFAISVILFSVREIVLVILNKGSRQDKWRRVDLYDLVALTKWVKSWGQHAIAKMTIRIWFKDHQIEHTQILYQTFLSHFLLISTPK